MSAEKNENAAYRACLCFDENMSEPAAKMVFAAAEAEPAMEQAVDAAAELTISGLIRAAVADPDLRN